MDSDLLPPTPRVLQTAFQNKVFSLSSVRSIHLVLKYEGNVTRPYQLKLPHLSVA